MCVSKYQTNTDQLTPALSSSSPNATQSARITEPTPAGDHIHTNASSVAQMHTATPTETVSVRISTTELMTVQSIAESVTQSALAALDQALLTVTLVNSTRHVTRRLKFVNVTRTGLDTTARSTLEHATVNAQAVTTSLATLALSMLIRWATHVNAMLTINLHAVRHIPELAHPRVLLLTLAHVDLIQVTVTNVSSTHIVHQTETASVTMTGVELTVSPIQESATANVTDTALDLAPTTVTLAVLTPRTSMDSASAMTTTVTTAVPNSLDSATVDVKHVPDQETTTVSHVNLKHLAL